MAWTDNKSNYANWLRLLKYAKSSEIEMKEYGIKPLRYGSYYNQTIHHIWWETPFRRAQRSWKSHRKTQYK